MSLLIGDCLEVMAGMPEASVDAVVCDPPYGLGFMGQKWDTYANETGRKPAAGAKFDHVGGNHNPTSSADASRTRAVEAKRFGEWCEAWAVEALRVLKPGGHLLAFGGTRTYHRLACAVEDAGFEIRDQLAWLYGSGFPKSLDVSKAIDKAAGAERAVVGHRPIAYPDSDTWGTPNSGVGTTADQSMFGTGEIEVGGTRAVTAPATPDAETWQGWGTALKPAHEPIVMARKPLTGTVASTVLEFGTGALNVDGCRIESGEDHRAKCESVVGLDSNRNGAAYGEWKGERESSWSPAGRWPANVLLDEEAAALLDEQTGDRPGQHAQRRDTAITDLTFGAHKTADVVEAYGDSGGASRFFYCAKSSSAERNAGLDGFDEREAGNFEDDAYVWATDGRGSPRAAPIRKANVHPTVKPIELMRWLIRLVTPPGGTILDPFTGSGTTGCAAALEGFTFIGIEREPEYAQIAEARIAWWAEHPEGVELVDRIKREQERTAVADRGQGSIFDLLGDAA